jgi:hypothetical protein
MQYWTTYLGEMHICVLTIKFPVNNDEKSLVIKSIFKYNKATYKN